MRDSAALKHLGVRRLDAAFFFSFFRTLATHCSCKKIKKKESGVEPPHSKVLHNCARLFRAMHIAGQRIKRTRLIQTEKYVGAVEVEMVIPKQRAERGDVSWLTKKGKVYAVVEAA